MSASELPPWHPWAGPEVIDGLLLGLFFLPHPSQPQIFLLLSLD